jgi:hypothetical protein
MQAGGINLFGVVADSFDRERLNQTYMRVTVSFAGATTDGTNSPSCSTWL